MPSNHLILCHPNSPPALNLFQLWDFSSELALCIRWPKNWSCSFSISPSSEYSGLISWILTGLTAVISLQSKGLSRLFSSTTIQKHLFFCAQSYLWTNSHIHTWLLKPLEPPKLLAWGSDSGRPISVLFPGKIAIGTWFHNSAKLMAALLLRFCR